jgi:hypothetical protein
VGLSLHYSRETHPNPRGRRWTADTNVIPTVVFSGPLGGRSSHRRLRRRQSAIGPRCVIGCRGWQRRFDRRWWRRWDHERRLSAEPSSRRERLLVGGGKMHLGHRAAAGLSAVGDLHVDGVGAHHAARPLHGELRIDPGGDLQRHVGRVCRGQWHLALRVRAVQLHVAASPGPPLRRMSDGTAARHAGLVLSWGAEPFIALSVDRPERRCGV